MKIRYAAVALVMLSGCFPLSRGKDLEERVNKLDATQQDQTRALAEQRDALKAQASDLQTKVADMQARLDKLDKASRTSDADVGVQISTVRDDLAQLRGQVEEYQHRIDVLDQGLKDLSTTTDAKLASIKGPDALKQYQAQQEASKLQRPADKVEFLKLADSKASGGDPLLAQQLYQEWLKKWPKDPLAAQAHYNLGRIYQQQSHHREAISEFGEVASNFKKSAQAPAALLASSESFAALGMNDLAKKALEAVVAEYPKSAEAKVAHEKLKKPAPKKKGK